MVKRYPLHPITTAGFERGYRWSWEENQWGTQWDRKSRDPLRQIGQGVELPKPREWLDRFKHLEHPNMIVKSGIWWVLLYSRRWNKCICHLVRTKIVDGHSHFQVRVYTSSIIYSLFVLNNFESNSMVKPNRCSYHWFACLSECSRKSNWDRWGCQPYPHWVCICPNP